MGRRGVPEGRQRLHREVQVRQRPRGGLLGHADDGDRQAGRPGDGDASSISPACRWSSVDVTCAGGTLPRRAVAGALLPRFRAGRRRRASCGRFPSACDRRPATAAANCCSRSARRSRSTAVRPGSWATPARAATTAPPSPRRWCGRWPRRSKRCRRPSAWPCCRTNGRWSAPDATTSGPSSISPPGSRRAHRRGRADAGRRCFAPSARIRDRRDARTPIAPGSASCSPRRLARSASAAARRTTTSGRRCARRSSPCRRHRRATRELLASRAQLVEQELDKPGSVEPTLLAVLVKLAAIDGDAALYDRYLERSKAATDPEEQYRYLYALTAFAIRRWSAGPWIWRCRPRSDRRTRSS